jgi:hypothetical protein
MMDFNPITAIIGAVGKTVDSIGDAIDKNVTSDEERLQMRNDLAQLQAQVETAVSEAVTARHEADMQSDAWLPKNIRPIVLASLTIFTMIYMIIGFWVSNESALKAYSASLEAILSLDMLAYGFYFGSRGVEKVATRIAAALRKPAVG